MTLLSGSTLPVYCRMEVSPATGSTTTVLAPYDVVYFTNSSTTAAQTLVLPASPTDGFVIAVCAASAITALTLSPTVTNGATAMTAGGCFRVMYSATQGAWFPFP